MYFMSKGEKKGGTMKEISRHLSGSKRVWVLKAERKRGSAEL